MRLLDVKFLKTLKITIMLLPDNIHPENSIYYNGSFVLDSLKQNQRFNLFDLYQEVKSKKPMSFSIFILCLDWLYLIDVARINNLGEIELCS